ncbi:MAG: hypothetical protein ACO1QB_13940 [Verrucomicrobiales bacterium]
MENESGPIAEQKDEAGETPAAPLEVEKLFPFVRKTRSLIMGRDTLERSKSRLQFLLITTDISDNSKNAMLKEYEHYPVVQYYSSADLERHFGCNSCKVVGFEKSDLSKAVYAGLKQFRINKPASGSNSTPASGAAMRPRVKRLS